MKFFKKPYLRSPEKFLKPLEESLLELLELANLAPLKFRAIVKVLKGRGLPVFLIFLTLPFCLPIPIPGLSTPFGLLIAFMGLRLAFGKKVYWPKWILEKEIPYKALYKIVNTSIVGLRWTKKFIRPRFILLCQNPVAHRIHGIFVCVLGLLLALPLPIPFSNYTSSIPLLFLGIGLLEDDGLFVFMSYILGFFTFLFWAAVIFYSHEGYKALHY